MKNLSKTDLIRIVKGSSWFGTGGGMPLSQQLERISELPENSCGLVFVEQLSPHDLVCCAYGLGSAANTDVALTEAFLTAMAEAERLKGGRCKAIFPAEVNIESMIIGVARSLELPILDADTCGGRAVPELRYDNFTLLKRSIAPIVACNSVGKIKVIEKYDAIDEVEAELRTFAVESPMGSIAVVDHIITAVEAASTLTTGTVDRSLRVGKIIEEIELGIKSREECYAENHLKIFIDDAEVEESKLTDSSGFLIGKVRLKTKDGTEVILSVQNEILVMEARSRVVAEAPSLIIPLNPQTLTGLHSTQLIRGCRVSVGVIEESSLWRTAEAYGLFAKSRKLLSGIKL